MSQTPIFALFQLLPIPAVTELAVEAGYDAVILDCDHGVMDESAIISCLHVLSAGIVMSGLRVRAGDFETVGRVTEIGIDVVVMSDIDGPQGAENFVAAARGKTKPLLFATIECGRAVAAIDHIVAVPGLGGITIGPNDLSADLGCGGDFAAAPYRTALETIENAALGAGCILGTRPHGAFDAATLIERGHRFIVVGADVAAIRGGLVSQLKAARR